MVYAWLLKGLSCFVSSCGTTVLHHIPYKTKYDDKFWNIATKELKYAVIANFLYDSLPLIDEHGKISQIALSLEKCLLTKEPWFTNVTTSVDMWVVHLQPCDQNLCHGIGKSEVNSNTDPRYEFTHKIKMFVIGFQSCLRLHQNSKKI